MCNLTKPFMTVFYENVANVKKLVGITELGSLNNEWYIHN